LTCDVFSFSFEGGGASKPDALDAIIEAKLKLTTDQLGLGRKELLPFWKEFNKIDVDQKGKIQLDEIFMTKKILETEWGRAVRVPPPPTPHKPPQLPDGRAAPADAAAAPASPQLCR
jgi:hypothetical protein